MRFALSPLPIRLALAPPLPHPGLAHPAPQTLGMNLQPIIARQVLAGQRGPEIRVAIPHPAEHRAAKLRRVRTIRPPSAVAVLERFRSPSPISRPHPFGLPIA